MKTSEWEGQMEVTGSWWEVRIGINGLRVSVLQENGWRDGHWQWLHSVLDIFNTARVHPENGRDGFYKKGERRELKTAYFLLLAATPWIGYVHRNLKMRPNNEQGAAEGAWDSSLISGNVANTQSTASPVSWKVTGKTPCHERLHFTVHRDRHCLNIWHRRWSFLP